MDQPLLQRAPEEGARLLALSFLDQAAAAFPRLSDPADTEALHDFRVALRRLRSSLRSYAPLLEKSLPKKLRRRLRDLAQATGPGRDTEVQIEWLRPRGQHLAPHHRAGLVWLLARLDDRMQAAYADINKMLEDRFPGVEKDLRHRLSVYRTEVHLDARAQRPTFSAVTADILRGQTAELEMHLARVGDADDEEEAHEARISAKRLRYLLEPLIDELPAAAPLVKRLKGLQEILGELHDAHVLETELRAGVGIAAAERASKLFEVSITEVLDEKVLRAERRRSVEPGLISLARLNRARRDRLFQKLETGWLNGADGDFHRDLHQLAARLSSQEEGKDDEERSEEGREAPPDNPSSGVINPS